MLSTNEALERLKGRLDARFALLVEHNLRRHNRSGRANVLWCAGAWARPKTPPCSDAELADVALIVIDGPLVTKKSLSLRYEDFTGSGFVARDDAGFLVLGELRARDLFSVPDALALFPEGITVERIASFEGADSLVQVAHHLHAPVVISGLGSSGGQVSPGTEVRIGAYARHLGGLPAKSAKRFETLEELLPFLEDDGDDDWARVESLKDEALPASFKLPALGASMKAQKPAKSKGPPKKTAKKR